MDEIGAQPVARRREVRQHDIERERLEPAQQFRLRGRAQHDLHIRAADQGGKEADLEIARQRRERPHPQDPPPGAAALERRRQIPGGAKDRLGMVERDAPGLGQDQPAAAPFEQRMAERGLERADLGRERRLRQVQPPRGRGQNPVPRDGMKEAQVVEVEDGHGNHSI